MPPAVWRVLQTRFDNGLRFFAAWQAWQANPHPPRILHVVALTTTPCSADALLQAVADHPTLLPLAQELASQWFGLLPGFHRLVLADGCVMLTLCVGPRQTMLREQQFLADAVVLADEPWDVWQLKALTRCCRRGTQLSSPHLAPSTRQLLVQSGFDLHPSESHGVYHPRWELKRTRSPWARPTDITRSCVVIGAGLAGASVAAALAHRGWQVVVLDAASEPATGASGLPVGLVVPHVSADDSPRSRLSRSGIRLTLQQAQQWLSAGRDWAMPGVLELRPDAASGRPSQEGWAGGDWSQTAHASSYQAQSWAQGMPCGTASLWHLRAGWIKPAQLVQAWLAQPGVQFRGTSQANALLQGDDGWTVLDAAGRTLAVAAHVVLANANGLLNLLQQVPGAPKLALAAVHGQVSWAPQGDAAGASLPPHPVNGHGHVLGHVPTPSGLAWFTGASFELAGRARATEPELHAANLARLQALLPVAGAALATDFASGAVRAWSQSRCVSADRLPLAGPLMAGHQPTLWVSTAMGSRGLSFAVLCAELVAAQMNAEPLPLEASLARHLHPLRMK